MTADGDGGVPEDERDALVTIAHGAVVTAGGVSGQRAITTALEVLLARGLGPAAYGVYALAWRIAQILLRLVTFGSVPALQRYLPAYANEPQQRRTVLGLAYITTISFGLAFVGGIWMLAPWLNEQTVRTPAFVPTIRWFSVLVGLLGILGVVAGTLRAVGSARGEVLVNKLLRPGVRLVAAVIALGAGYSIVGIAGAIVIGTAILVLVAVPTTTWITGIRPAVRGSRSEAYRFYDHAGPVALSSLGKVFQNRIDVLLVGALLTAVSTGIYNALLVIVSIAWIPLLSFNQLLPPVASELYADGKITTLNAIYTAVTRLIVTTVVPLLAILVVYGQSLLSVFGATYIQGYLPLVVYLSGVFVGSAVGATGWLLMMTDHQYARMALDWLLAVLNIVLTYLFIIELGLVGAALGTSIAIAVQNGLQVLLLRYFEGLWPFDRTFLTPLFAGGSTIGVMLGIRTVVQGWTGVVLGSLTGLAVYLAILWGIGLAPRDRIVIAELTEQYKQLLGTQR